MAEIRNVIFDALPKSSGSVRLSDLRLVQVDYVMMPGKEQAGSMSAREVAVKKNLLSERRMKAIRWWRL